MSSQINYCPICNSEASEYNTYLSSVFVECPSCGRFKKEIFFVGDNSDPTDNDKLASYLYYNVKLNPPINDDRFFAYIGSKATFGKTHAEYPWCSHITNDIVNSWYPKTFSEKVDMFLLGLASRANFLSENIIFSEEQLKSACFVLRNPKGPMHLMPNIVTDQLQFFLKFLEDQQYISVHNCQCVLLPNGLERIDSLQKNFSKNTKNVFVAMSFAPEMVEVREALKTAILECGLVPRIMDEIEHNHQIVPEMLYEIRESRFVIAELTGHNNGAYFEAGYALGCGKEVIQVCQKSKFNEDGHFDVKQINSILWDTTDELSQKLTARIKATIL